MGSGSETLPPIGELLVQAGLLTPGVLAEVLELQKTEKRRLGDLLAERDLVPPRRLAQVLSYQLSCPWLSLVHFEIPPGVIELVPRELALRHTLVPVYVREEGVKRTLCVAAYDPTDADALGEVAAATRMTVKPMVAITYEIRQALARYYGAPTPSLRTAPKPAASPPSPATGANKPAKPPVPPKPVPPVAARAPDAGAPPASVAVVERPERAEPPRILVLNAPEAFHEQCAIAARAVGGELEPGNLLNAAERVKASKPAAIVVTDDVYAFDRPGLNRLALESDALLVVWSDDGEAAQLEPLLEGAVRRGRRASSP